MKSEDREASVLEVHLARYELRRGARLVRLERQPMELLILLAVRKGELVTREAIVEQLWPAGVFVDTERGINNAMRKIRSALRDDADRPRYIETVVGKGYRFIGPVRVIDRAAPAGGSSQMPTQMSEPTGAVWPAASAPVQPRARLRGLLRIATVPAVLILLALAGRWYVQRAIAAPPAASIRAVAVLPLENLSGDPGQDYFADGMSDELTTQLARIPGLRVTSRLSSKSYAGRHEPLPRIAQALGVDAVVEGSVVRTADRVRISVQLIDARSDRHLWADSFEGALKDVLALQDDVARQIATRIQRAVDAGRARPTNPVFANPEAHDAYLRGRYFFDRRSRDDLRRSASYFERAIAIDPGYAAAYAGLSDALTSEGFLGVVRPLDVAGRARTAAETALKLDPNLGEAYTALGGVQVAYEWNWDEAAQNLRRGIELSPSDPVAEIFYSMLLSGTGRTADAVGHARRALELDPLSFFTNRNLGAMLYFARRDTDALDQLRRTEELSGNIGVVENWISWIDAGMGRQDESVQADLKGLSAAGIRTDALDRLRAIYANHGWNAYWQARIDGVLAEAPATTCSGYELAVMYLRTGNSEAAFPWLHRAIDSACVWDTFIRVDPKLDEARSDPRFTGLLTRIHQTAF